MNNYPRRLILLFLPLLPLMFFQVGPAAPAGLAAAAPSGENEIRAAIKIEEERAQSRRATLSGLTQQERNLNSSLAKLEANVLKLEKELAAQRAKLLNLAKSDAEAKAAHDKLMQERNKSEAAMRGVLRAIWEIYNRRESAGGRELDEWPALDRDYQWTASLFAALDQHRQEIVEQERLLGELAGRRVLIGREISESAEEMEREKTAVLAERLKFERSLADLRKQRRDAQTELDSTLKLIANLNFNLQSLQSEALDIDKAKGRLVWPATGKIVLKFRPAARPPMQGLGIAADAGAAVRAAHGGKIMYNDTMRGLGRVIVIQHGDIYFTVYAFLSETLTRQGEAVARGQEIGRVGYYPALKGNGVYFELRRHQQPVDPESWLGAM